MYWSTIYIHWSVSYSSISFIDKWMANLWLLYNNQIVYHICTCIPVELQCFDHQPHFSSVNVIHKIHSWFNTLHLVDLYISQMRSFWSHGTCANHKIRDFVLKRSDRPGMLRTRSGSWMPQKYEDLQKQIRMHHSTDNNERQLRGIVFCRWQSTRKVETFSKGNAEIVMEIIHKLQCIQWTMYTVGGRGSSSGEVGFVPCVRACQRSRVGAWKWFSCR